MRITSIVGYLTLLLIAWLISSNRKNVNWRVITWGAVIQITFAGFLFIFPVGAKIFYVYKSDSISCT